MRKGKVSFLWDVGSGVGRVEYPDLTIDDSYWYRIEVQNCTEFWLLPLLISVPGSQKRTEEFTQEPSLGIYPVQSLS